MHFLRNLVKTCKKGYILQCTEDEDKVNALAHLNCNCNSVEYFAALGAAVRTPNHMSQKNIN